MPAIPAFDESILKAICDILGHTDSGLSGSEIARVLAQQSIPDVAPAITKRHRLFEALFTQQQAAGVGTHVAGFVMATMKPVNYLNSKQQFEQRRGQLNEALSFAGLQVNESGELHHRQVAKTLTEAEQRAGRLRRALEERNVHGDVLRFCDAELLQDNYFHAVFEATKSVADKIRSKAGLTSDGAALVYSAFGLGKSGIPVLAFNTLQAESETSEQKGLTMLIKGLFGAFRNVTAHAPKIHWSITEQDAMDILTVASLIHRRLDSAVPTNPDA